MPDLGGHGEPDRGAAVAERVLDPIGRMSRIDGHIRGAGLRDRPQCQDRLVRPRRRYRNQVFRSDSLPDQAAATWLARQSSSA